MKITAILLACLGLCSGCSTVLIYKLPERPGPIAHLVDERNDEFKKHRYFRRSAAAQLGDEDLSPQPLEYLAERLGQAAVTGGDTRIRLQSFVVLVVAPHAHQEAIGGVASNPIAGVLSPILSDAFSPVNTYGMTSDFVYVFIRIGTKNGVIEARARVPFQFYTDMPECRHAVTEALEKSTDELVQKIAGPEKAKGGSENISR